MDRIGIVALVAALREEVALVAALRAEHEEIFGRYAVVFPPGPAEESEDEWVWISGEADDDDESIEGGYGTPVQGSRALAVAKRRRDVARAAAARRTESLDTWEPHHPVPSEEEMAEARRVPPRVECGTPVRVVRAAPKAAPPKAAPKAAPEPECAREGCSGRPVSRSPIVWRRAFCRQCLCQGHYHLSRGRISSVQEWLEGGAEGSRPPSEQPPLTASQRAALVWLATPKPQRPRHYPAAIAFRMLYRRGLLREAHRGSQLTQAGMQALESVG